MLENLECVCVRKTFDGIPLNFMADGTIQGRMEYYPRGKPLTHKQLWFIAGCICMWEYKELPELIRKVKKEVI